MQTAAHSLSMLEAFAAPGRKRDVKPSNSPDRSMQLQVTDLGHTHYATLVGRHAENIAEQVPDAVDMVLEVDGDTLVQLFSGQLSPFVAPSSRRVKLDAPVRDMALLRALFLGAGP